MHSELQKGLNVFSLIYFAKLSWMKETFVMENEIIRRRKLFPKME